LNGFSVVPERHVIAGVGKICTQGIRLTALHERKCIELIRGACPALNLCERSQQSDVVVIMGQMSSDYVYGNVAFTLRSERRSQLGDDVGLLAEHFDAAKKPLLGFIWLVGKLQNSYKCPELLNSAAIVNFCRQ
jgi:hypothetical protein